MNSKSRMLNFSILKLGDFLVVLVLIICTTILLLSMWPETAEGHPYAHVRIGNEIIDTIDLAAETPAKIDLKGKFHGAATAEVADGKIRILHSDCGEQICVNSGWAMNEGDTISCFPYQINITIFYGPESTGVDAITGPNRPLIQ